MAMLFLMALPPPAHGVDLRVRWEYPEATSFTVHVRQPGAIGQPSFDHVMPALEPDVDGLFEAEVPVPDPFAGVVVSVSVQAADGIWSERSNEVTVSAGRICGARGCDDGIDCTLDLCDGSGACHHIADHGLCPDGESCSRDVCDPVQGCRWEPAAGECNDGRACTAGDLCFAGECAGSVDCPRGAVCDGVTGDCRADTGTTATSTTLAPRPDCGDGFVQSGEDCDGGAAPWSPGGACRDDCTRVRCGDPDDSGAITAVDALLALLGALGAARCDGAVCNVDASGARPSTVDALRILQRAAGVDIELLCDPPGRAGRPAPSP